MNALRPSFRNDSFVSFVAGILVAALMLVGGPTAYASIWRIPTVRTSPPCDGTVSFPSEAQAWVEAQCTARQALFGDQSDPGICYLFDAPVSETGVHEGRTWMNEDITVNVVHTIPLDFATHAPDLFALGIEAWTVYAMMSGPVGAIPVWGLGISHWPGSDPHVFLMCEILTVEQLDTFELATQISSGNINWLTPGGGLQTSQEDCIRRKIAAYNIDAAQAKSTQNVCAAFAVGAFLACMGRCTFLAMFAATPIGALAFALCAASCLGAQVVMLGMCQTQYSIDMRAAFERLKLELEECGVSVPHD